MWLSATDHNGGFFSSVIFESLYLHYAGKNILTLILSMLALID